MEKRALPQVVPVRRATKGEKGDWCSNRRASGSVAHGPDVGGGEGGGRGGGKERDAKGPIGEGAAGPTAGGTVGLGTEGGTKGTVGKVAGPAAEGAAGLGVGRGGGGEAAEPVGSGPVRGEVATLRSRSGASPLRRSGPQNPISTSQTQRQPRRAQCRCRGLSASAWQVVVKQAPQAALRKTLRRNPRQGSRRLQTRGATADEARRRQYHGCSS